MNSQTRIIVIRQKNLIYLAVALAVILLLIIFILFSSRNSAQDDTSDAAEYIAGVYSSTIVLNGNPVDIQVVMDNDKIHSIGLVNTAESITTMYPVFSSCFDDIREQVISQNSAENIVYASDNRYTSIVITNAIREAINKARP
jgi:uncharacterized protein with FMN-binding domain